MRGFERGLHRGKRYLPVRGGRRAQGFTSPRRGEVGGRRPPGEGITIFEIKQRPCPPRPTALPSGESGSTAARPAPNTIVLSLQGRGGECPHDERGIGPGGAGGGEH